VPEHDKLQGLILLADACNNYSKTAINHLMHPRNMGVLPDDDSFAKITGPCGDIMEIWIRVRQGTITKARFMAKGCGASIASGSMVTVLAIGKTIAEAGQISQCDILAALGGLPEEVQHCALLASNTLIAAISNFLATPREPWNRAYRKY
jgi:nitrogen fixation protein NifU and related proteins